MKKRLHCRNQCDVELKKPALSQGFAVHIAGDDAPSLNN